MIARALNQKTASHHSFAEFLRIAAETGCMGVEARNDLPGAIFGGHTPAEARAMLDGFGLRLLGLSEVYPFNDWSDARAVQVQSLIDLAHAYGAETVSLIPRVDGLGCGATERRATLRAVLREIAPMLEGRNVVALVEPIGFETSSLKIKAEVVEAIEAVADRSRFRIVHDTFQHCIAGGGPFFIDHTAMVHLSGVTVPAARLDAAMDMRRVLVDANDRTGSIAQVHAFLEAGYTGPMSFECTDESVLRSATLAEDIKASFAFIDRAMTA